MNKYEIKYYIIKECFHGESILLSQIKFYIILICYLINCIGNIIYTERNFIKKLNFNTF